LEERRGRGKRFRAENSILSRKKEKREIFEGKRKRRVVLSKVEETT